MHNTEPGRASSGNARQRSICVGLVILTGGLYHGYSGVLIDPYTALPTLDISRARMGFSGFQLPQSCRVRGISPHIKPGCYAILGTEVWCRIWTLEGLSGSVVVVVVTVRKMWRVPRFPCCWGRSEPPHPTGSRSPLAVACYRAPKIAP